MDMNRPKTIISICLMLFGLSLGANAQSKLYPQLFDLGDVTLNGGPFLHAMTLNDSILLEYDLGRLMQPYEKQAGLTESGKAFDNWCGDRGLDGHVGGHYLSALAISYASCQNAAKKALLKERLDKFVNRLKDCQDAWDKNDSTIMHGYCGGVPHSYDLWTSFAKGDMTEYWKSWVPLYNIHKTYAGLRDAWVYAGNEIANQTDTQLQNVLGNEHGGINEMFADAYQMTKDARYLKAAKRFAHRWLLQGMALHRGTLLDNVHANTQVPKVIGFERTYQQDRVSTYGNAARFFWQNVTGKRTIAVGGNSISEWFPDNSHYGNFITSPDGVETCNSNNMLKLSEDIFADEHDSKYVDFFEGTLYNHILSSQNPRTGGYVYFTSARPQHYRVYSQVNQAMWCCVGSGMENHGKYGQFIYSRHNTDSLFVNLFVASELNWSEKQVVVRQDTRFPYEQGTTLTLARPTNVTDSFTLLVRHPKWVAATAFVVRVNGTPLELTSTPGSYVAIRRPWANGDVIRVELPMRVA